MPATVELMLSIFSGVNSVMLALLLWIANDFRMRLLQLERHAMEEGQRQIEFLKLTKT